MKTPEKLNSKQAMNYYYTCIYNARKFSNDTESEALAVTI